MTAYALKRRLGQGAAGTGDWLVVALTAVWTAYAVNLVYGLTSVPTVEGVDYLTLLLFPPGALVLLAALRRDSNSVLIPWAAGWATIVALAVLAAFYAPALPEVSLGVPALAISAIACARWPVAATAAVLFMTGAFNSLEAFLAIPARPLVDLTLGGLWAGAIWSYLFSSRERPVWIWPGIALGVLYLALSAAWVFQAESVYIGIRAFRESAWYMSAFLLMAYAPWDKETHVRIARAFVAIGALVGAYATFRWLVGPDDRELFLATLASRTQEVVAGELRVFGSLNSGKALSAWTAAMIPFCVALALTFTGRWRVIAGTAAGLCAIGLLGSEARAGFVAAVAGVAIVLVLYQLARGFRGLHLGVTGLAIAAIVGVGIFAFSQTAGNDQESSTRYTSLVNFTEDPSYQARLFKWRTALETIDEHPFGQGLGTSGGVQQAYGRFLNISSSSIDSSYLKIAFEQGLLVLALFVVALLALLGGMARRSISTPDRDKAGIGIGASGALAAFLVIMYSGTYVDGLTALTAWLLIGLGVAQFTAGRGNGRPSS